MTGTARFDPAFLTRATAGRRVGDPHADRVDIDSRHDLTGALFVALAGENHDGHDYVDAAFAAGAAAALVSEAWWVERGRPAGRPLLVVDDTLSALQGLAAAHRNRFDLPVVAVTGSNGKTTTKELLAAALGGLGQVLKTRGNRNNHIGLPLTLLELTPDHRAAVVELGMNHAGEIALLSRLARPRVAVITNVSEAHLHGLGDRKGVARAKAEIVEGLGPEGALVLPWGDADLEEALRGYRGRRITFGTEAGADERLKHAETEAGGVRLETESGAVVRLRLVGRHLAGNALAALAAAEALGVAPGDAAEGMGSVEPIAGRLRPLTRGGVLLLDDTYNANPASLAAALDALRDQPVTGRRWAVLGNMLELGPDEAALHRAAGADAAFVDGLVVVGHLARELGVGAVAAGLPRERLREAGGPVEAASMLLAELRVGDAVLLKGSRGARLEIALEAILAGLEERG